MQQEFLKAITWSCYLAYPRFDILAEMAAALDLTDASGVALAAESPTAARGTYYSSNQARTELRSNLRVVFHCVTGMCQDSRKYN